MLKKKDIKITTIIVSLNSAKDITGAIDSFLDQEYDNKELIMFDGMSIDGTHDIIKSYADKYPNLIKWINGEKDTGISDARNKAIKHATGDYIGFLGADDRLCNNIYKEISKYHLMSEMDYFHIIYFDSLINKDNILRPRIFISSFLSTRLSSQISIRKTNFLLYVNVIPGEAAYYHKNVFKDLQFNVENKFTMDFELNIKLLSKYKSKLKQLLIPCFGLLSNFSNDNISSKHSNGQFKEAMLLLYRNYGIISVPFIILRYILKFFSIGVERINK